MTDLLKLGPKERITTGLHRALTEGVLQKDGTYKLLEVDSIQKILQDHNLSLDEFGLIFLSDVSDAAKTLQSYQQLGKIYKAKDAERGIDALNAQLNGLINDGYASFPQDVALEVAQNTKKVLNMLKTFL